MATEFVGRDVWPAISKALSSCRGPCHVAVAYLGRGSAQLLPLPVGSRLVVDASERAVMSGQTCPADLLAMLKRGTRVFSVANLHAKVFVIGQNAFVGSSNASSRSRAVLIEAILRSNDPIVAKAAKTFVRGLCLRPLTPGYLRKLDRIYRPPRIPGLSTKRSAKDSARVPALGRTIVAQIDNSGYTPDEKKLLKSAIPAARKRRRHGAGYQLDDFIDYGHRVWRSDDVVIQMNDFGGGDVLVAPPGNIVDQRSRKIGHKVARAIFVERPDRRRRSLRSLASILGRGSMRKLKRDGVVKNQDFLRSLLAALS